MTAEELVKAGRAAFERWAWRGAVAKLSAADREGTLEPEDLERLAKAAYLTGADDESTDAWARAHQAYLSRSDEPAAARCAFWLGMQLMNRGEMAPAGGWLGRAGTLLEQGGHDCVESGYLFVPMGLQRLYGGDPGGAHEAFSEAARVGERFGDPDLITLGRLGRGRTLVYMRETEEGVTLLDEAMVAVTASEVSPTVAGIVYCAVIEACHEIFDVRRAHEWTEALSRWCESQPDLVPYRGQCLVHRAQILQLHGQWPDAMEEAHHARERLSEPAGQPAVGMAYYQLGELHRLRGEFERAEEAYRQAGQWGRGPHPGLALLRLAQGRVDAGAAAIRRVLDTAAGPVARASLLPGYVEIMLASGDVAAGRKGADELADIAAELGAPLLEAASAGATGAVYLAEDDARSAATSLERAWTAWNELEAPYEAARVRALVGAACRSLGDDDSAQLAFDDARRAFDQLGAAPAVEWVERLSRSERSNGPEILTARELEVLALVATGKTNREIARGLVISEKTVARHISNIFTKLGLSSRSAATAYAYEHNLV